MVWAYNFHSAAFSALLILAQIPSSLPWFLLTMREFYISTDTNHHGICLVLTMVKAKGELMLYQRVKQTIEPALYNS